MKVIGGREQIVYCIMHQASTGRKGYLGDLLTSFRFGERFLLIRLGLLALIPDNKNISNGAKVNVPMNLPGTNTNSNMISNG